MPLFETIVPLIELCEKIECLNNDELFEFTCSLMQILSNHDLLAKHLIKCLCYNHKNFSTEIFYEIMQIIPTAKDSNQIEPDKDSEKKQLIVAEEHIHDIITIKNIVDIPTELLIHTAQYLTVNDLYHLEKSCRYLCRIARNPNSLYYLHLDHDQFYGIYGNDDDNISLFSNYNHPRYLNIKSLHLIRADGDIENFMKFLPTFSCLQALKYDNDNGNWLLKIPVTLFHSKFHTFESLQVIQFRSMKVVDVYNFIIKCRNIKKLTLDDVIDSHEASYLSITDTIVYKQINERNSTYPLLQMKEFSISLYSVDKSFSAQYLTYWILSNGEKK
eukprot:420104_1